MFSSDDLSSLFAIFLHFRNSKPSADKSRKHQRKECSVQFLLMFRHVLRMNKTSVFIQLINYLDK